MGVVVMSWYAEGGQQTVWRRLEAGSENAESRSPQRTRCQQRAATRSVPSRQEAQCEGLPTIIILSLA